jgi:hypothetical protein
VDFVVEFFTQVIILLFRDVVKLNSSSLVLVAFPNCYQRMDRAFGVLKEQYRRVKALFKRLNNSRLHVDTLDVF